VANALSALRLLAALPFAFAMARADERGALAAALLLAFAIASDVADGALARRRGTESAFGRLLDHGADATFVVAGLAGAAARGALPWLLPLLVSFAFAQYVIDSFVLHRAPTLRMSRLGRANGILYFAPLVGDAAARLVHDALGAPTHALAWALCVTTLASMADRLWALRPRRRTAPGSPGPGTGARSPR
jgi:phosphatidylglycerophosphate synthase